MKLFGYWIHVFTPSRRGGSVYPDLKPSNLTCHQQETRIVFANIALTDKVFVIEFDTRRVGPNALLLRLLTLFRMNILRQSAR